LSLTNYPTALDNGTSLPTVVDRVTPVAAVSVNRLRDAILAIETELGTDPSRVYGNVRARLDDLRAEINTLKAQTPPGFDAALIYSMAGVVTTSFTGYTRIGSFTLNPIEYLLGIQVVTITVEAIIEDSNSNNCDIRLFNVTNNEVIGSDPLFTTTSATPVEVTSEVTLPNGDRLYEVQMRMRTGTAPDTVTCSGSRVVASQS